MNETQDNRIRILIVDDESIVLSLVRDALEDEDYDVETAARGTEALKVIESKEINLIVTDIRMPDINGIDLVKRVRAVQPDIGVIFMTGYANLNSAKNAIKQGAFDYILKPFELDEIRRAVKSAVKKIKKEATDKSPDHQLDRLSDLNQMLIAVGDRSTLSTVSLRFAIMHCQSDRGAIVFWDRARTAFSMITIVEDRIEEESLPLQPLSNCLDKVSFMEFQEPVFVSGTDEHPLCKAYSEPELRRCLFPRWITAETQMVAVPVKRADSLLGVLMVGFPDDTSIVKGADLKLLSISASQLALSLENLELLEETQMAYARLKKLQDETIQLEKMATRGELSAEIGHELNNFLGVVTGNLSLLDFQLQKGNHNELGKYVQAMTDNIEKIKTFTSDLMELTPISSKKDTLYFDKLLGEVIDYLKPQRRFQGVNIRLLPIEHTIPLKADGVHIQQLLYNLFNNAADATAGRQKRDITVWCELNPDGETFSFHISDTGTGIEPELLTKLFNEKLTTKESGHGFGLVVCKRIVDGHDGKISLESTPDVGTTIQIDFPLAERVPVEAATP
jgi:signal transduction histidine kinase/DNA-binding response OmpR family regulator